MIYTMTETYYGGKFSQWFDFLDGAKNHHHIKWFNPETDYYNTLLWKKVDELSSKINSNDILIIDSEYFQPHYTQDTIIKLSEALPCDILVIHKDASPMESYKNVTVSKPMYNVNEETAEDVQRKFNFYILNYGTNEVVDLSYEIFDIFHNNTKIKKFLCTNGCNKPHRNVLYHFLKKYDILKNTFYSYSLHITDNDTIDNVFKNHNFNIDSDLKDLPIFLDFDYREPNQDPNSHFTPLTISSNCIFEIVSATQFNNNNEIFTSEKIFRPFIGFLFPIYVAQKGVCDLLRKMGFDLFDDIINHDYDLIEDNTERIIKVTNEIKRLNEISFEDLNKIRTSIEVKKRLLKNYNVIKDLATLQVEWNFGEKLKKYKSII